MFYECISVCVAQAHFCLYENLIISFAHAFNKIFGFGWGWVC